ncbi:hypothetical protein [Paraburkholderia graminis]
MKLPSNKGRSAPAAKTASEPIAPAASEQATPTGSGKYTGVLTLIVKERAALLEVIGPDEELALAQAAAAERNTTIDTVLRERLADLRGQRDSAWSAQRVLRAEMLEQMRLAAPAVTAALDERSRLVQTIRDLKARIAGFDAARRAFYGRLADAGLSDEEIAEIELKPTADDLAEWRSQLDAAQQRDADLAAKIARGAAAFLPEAA